MRGLLESIDTFIVFHKETLKQGFDAQMRTNAHKKGPKNLIRPCQGYSNRSSEFIRQYSGL